MNNSLSGWIFDICIWVMIVSHQMHFYFAGRKSGALCFWDGAFWICVEIVSCLIINAMGAASSEKKNEKDKNKEEESE